MVEQPKKILDQLRDVLRLKHYSYRTEQSYVDWAYRFIVFHNKRHPKDMGASEIETFLTYLAVQRKVAAPTQNQALSALVFLYRHVLHQDIGGHIDAVRAKQSRYLSTAQLLYPSSAESVSKPPISSQPLSTAAPDPRCHP
jgi:site-specific recombinase XerD